MVFIFFMSFTDNLISWILFAGNFMNEKYDSQEIHDQNKHTSK